jgi:DNA uptake protein ComE-like DNA-binding protein
MKSSIASSTFIALGLLLSTGFCSAADTKAVAPQAAASKASAPKAAGSAAAKPKAAAPVKLVDINGAKKAELKTLPGVGDAEADKIIAGRPYGSKAWLLSRNVVSAEVYDGVKGLVIAKQPTNDATKNAAALQKKK